MKFYNAPVFKLFVGLFLALAVYTVAPVAAKAVTCSDGSTSCGLLASTYNMGMPQCDLVGGDIEWFGSTQERILGGQVCDVFGGGDNAGYRMDGTGQPDGSTAIIPIGSGAPPGWTYSKTGFFWGGNTIPSGEFNDDPYYNIRFFGGSATAVNYGADDDSSITVGGNYLNWVPCDLDVRDVQSPNCPSTTVLSNMAGSGNSRSFNGNPGDAVGFTVTNRLRPNNGVGQWGSGSMNITLGQVTRCDTIAYETATFSSGRLDGYPYRNYHPTSDQVCTPDAEASLTINPTTVSLGSTTNLTWTCNGTATGSINPPIPGFNGSSVNGQTLSITPPAGTTTYVLTCTNAYNSATSSKQVTTNTLLPICSITANGSHSPAPVSAPGTANVAWTVSNGGTAGSVTRTPSGPTGSGINGSFVDSNLAAGTYTYTLNGSGSGGNCNDSVTLVVSGTPTAQLWVRVTGDVAWQKSITVSVGQNVDFMWTSTNGTTYTSTYSASPASTYCGSPPTGTWAINTSRGNFLNQPIVSCMAGFTVTLNYIVNGGAATDSVVVTISGGGPAINGTCGLANNQSFSSAPASNLCSTGTPTAVSGGATGPWSWTCNGQNDGSPSPTCNASYSSSGCTTETYQPAASGFAPTSHPFGPTSNTNLTVASGDTFYTFVDYGAVNDAIQAPSAPGVPACKIDTFLGTVARFICTASNTTGSYTYTTGTNNYPAGSNICDSGPQTMGTITTVSTSPDFTIHFNQPTSQSVEAGGAVSYQVEVDGQNGMTGTVGLSNLFACPTGATCIISPSSVNISSPNGKAAANLLITTSNMTPSGKYNVGVAGSWNSLVRVDGSGVLTVIGGACPNGIGNNQLIGCGFTNWQYVGENYIGIAPPGAQGTPPVDNFVALDQNYGNGEVVPGSGLGDTSWQGQTELWFGNFKVSGGTYYFTGKTTGVNYVNAPNTEDVYIDGSSVASLSATSLNSPQIKAISLSAGNHLIEVVYRVVAQSSTNYNPVTSVKSLYLAWTTNPITSTSAICDGSPHLEPSGGQTPNQPVGLYLPNGGFPYDNSVGIVMEGMNNEVYTQLCQFTGSTCNFLGWKQIPGWFAPTTLTAPYTDFSGTWEVWVKSGFNGATLKTYQDSAGWKAWSQPGGTKAWGTPTTFTDGLGKPWQLIRNADNTISYVCGTPPPAPDIQLNPTTFTFNGVSGDLTAPSAQSLTISDSVAATTLHWKAYTDKDWCRVNGINNAGSITGTAPNGSPSIVTVSVDLPSTFGTYACTITVSDNGSTPAVTGGSKTAQVTYTVSAVSSPPPPTTSALNTNLDSSVQCGTLKLVLTDNSTSEDGFVIFKSSTNDPATAVVFKTITSSLTDKAATGKQYSIPDTAVSYPNFYYYWAEAYVGSAPSTVSGNPSDYQQASAGPTSCLANLDISDKDITGKNYTPITYTNGPNACNGSTDALPGGTTFTLNDTVDFTLSICNNSSNSKAPATNIKVTDYLLNLQIPPASKGGWNAKYNGTPIPVSVGGTWPNQILTFNIQGTLAYADATHSGIGTLTFTAQIITPADFVGSTSRFQNTFTVDYNNSTGPTTTPVKRTPLIPFIIGGNIPDIHEIP